jgi:hypothetical protein
MKHNPASREKYALFCYILLHFYRYKELCFPRQGIGLFAIQASGPEAGKAKNILSILSILSKFYSFFLLHARLYALYARCLFLFFC